MYLLLHVISLLTLQVTVASSSDTRQPFNPREYTKQSATCKSTNLDTEISIRTRLSLSWLDFDGNSSYGVNSTRIRRRESSCEYKHCVGSWMAFPMEHLVKSDSRIRGRFLEIFLFSMPSNSVLCP
jgi:hypothetical protein